MRSPARHKQWFTVSSWKGSNTFICADALHSDIVPAPELVRSAQTKIGPKRRRNVTNSFVRPLTLRLVPSNLLISKIGRESDLLLRNLYEHYIHDMAEWFEIDTRSDGSYSYDTSWIWENGYDAYLAKVGDSIAGFAILGPAAEWVGGIASRDLREFFVIRRFRRNGLGQRMAIHFWNERPGNWLVRVLESNTPALLFWRAAISTYTLGAYAEEARLVDGRRWLFFRFVSHALTPAS